MVAASLDIGSSLPTARRPATLCIHFAARGGEHRISFAEAAPIAELQRARTARLVTEWQAEEAGLLRGGACLRGDSACEAWLLAGSPAGPAADRDLLQAHGLPRDRAALLARMPERPLLATVSRGPELSPQLLDRIHSLLVGSVQQLASGCIRRVGPPARHAGP